MQCLQVFAKTATVTFTIKRCNNVSSYKKQLPRLYLNDLSQGVKLSLRQVLTDEANFTTMYNEIVVDINKIPV